MWVWVLYLQEVSQDYGVCRISPFPKLQLSKFSLCPYASQYSQWCSTVHEQLPRHLIRISKEARYTEHIQACGVLRSLYGSAICVEGLELASTWMEMLHHLLSRSDWPFTVNASLYNIFIDSTTSSRLYLQMGGCKWRMKLNFMIF